MPEGERKEEREGRREGARVLGRVKVRQERECIIYKLQHGSEVDM